METDLIQNQVDGNGATMTIRHLFLQEIKSVRMHVEKEFVKLEERIEELILKHFLEETDRAKVLSNMLSYEQASGSPSIQSDVCDQEAYSENSSIFAHFEKIKEEFLLDEEQEGLQRLYFKKSEKFPKHVGENLSENFENNFYTSLSRSGVSDVSSNVSGIDDYSVNDGFLSDQESKSFQNATNKEPCASSALENFQGPSKQKGLTGICCRETVTNLGCMTKAHLRKPLHLSSKSARGQYTCEICDPPHTELDPSISAKQCSSRSGSFSSRIVIVKDEPSSVLEQQPSEPSQKSHEKQKRTFSKTLQPKVSPKSINFPLMQ
ncbi:unnamed protein product [Clavelina lepadiformis]|uniref:Uncharacterized protein n=1 Tax=Clavelina lepadiformis TaxID=159417 RepID=A0ABP0GJK0_CLALP